ncbi:MAG: transposase [Nitrospirae bacterium]|nr:transposase [Nitrospirota bacterium]MBI5406945.1 transposase [Nitrospirota bacterium]
MISDEIQNFFRYTARALTYIRHLYAIEKEADEKGHTIEERYQLRQEKTIPLLRQFGE